MTDIIARRQFAPLYIWLDIAFLCVFLALLLMKKKYMTVLVGGEGLRQQRAAEPPAEDQQRPLEQVLVL